MVGCAIGPNDREGIYLIIRPQTDDHSDHPVAPNASPPPAPFTWAVDLVPQPACVLSTTRDGELLVPVILWHKECAPLFPVNLQMQSRPSGNTSKGVNGGWEHIQAPSPW